MKDSIQFNSIQYNQLLIVYSDWAHLWWP